MGKGRNDINFLNDGFEITYNDGITESFHKNLFDNNYKGNKGSSIIGNKIWDGFTVYKYDGNKERFFYKPESDEFLRGNKGTRVRKNSWGVFVSENPYAGYKPPTISDLRKAKYQETTVRAYEIDKNNSTSIEELRNEIQNIIDAAGLEVHIADVTVNENSAVAIVSNIGLSYMPVCTYLSNVDGKFAVVSSVTGKGKQVNAADLGKLYYKAASPWGKLQIKMSRGSSLATHFGYSVRIGGALGGISSIAGFAVGGGLRLAAKGVKALFRDNDAYMQEMDFYNQALGIIDYAIGYNDSYDLNKSIVNRAELGIPFSQYQVGVAYIYGIGVETNEELAIEWFKKAAENGELRSQNIIAGEYLYNDERQYSIEEKKQAVGYLYNLASFGENWAWELLIDAFGRGTIDGIDVDYDEAIRIAQFLAENNNLFAAEFLAPIYDSKITSDDDYLQKYKNDNLAFSQYRIIAEQNNSDYAIEALMNLADMCSEGRGTEKSDCNAYTYLEIASSKGSLEAKEKLLYAYIFGLGTEPSKDKVKKLSKELIRSNNQEIISSVNYCLFSLADNEGKYRDSMKYAKAYLDGTYTEPDKVEYLEKYVSDMEHRISQMTDEERREFLHERKIIDSRTKKIILICTVIIFIVIVATVIVKNNLNMININNNENNKFDGDVLNAVEAYDDLLSKNEIDVGINTSCLWNSNNTKFNLAYIDNDNVPELLLCNYEDAVHEEGFGRIASYKNGNIEFLCLGLDSDNYKNAYGDSLGYYEETGCYSDLVMYQGYGNYCINRGLVLEKQENILEKDYILDENLNQSDTYYFINGNKGSKNKFYDELKSITNGVELTPYSFYENTENNRNKIFGISTSKKNTDNNDIYGVAFDILGKSFESVDEEYGPLKQNASWDGVIAYQTKNDRWIGFPAGWDENGETPSDAKCISYTARKSQLNEIFSIGENYTIEELAEILNINFDIKELQYDENLEYNSVIWEIEYNNMKYKVMIDYDGNFDIISISVNLLDTIDEDESYSDEYGNIVPINTIATSVLDNQGDNVYSPRMAYDGKNNTAWVEGVEGSGIGEEIIFMVGKKASVVKGINLLNGYCKNKTVYYNNNRIKKVKCIFDDGMSEIIYLDDEYNKLQSYTFDSSHTTKSITLRIMSVYRGSKYDDTCLTDVTFF